MFAAPRSRLKRALLVGLTAVAALACGTEPQRGASRAHTATTTQGPTDDDGQGGDEAGDSVHIAPPGDPTPADGLGDRDDGAASAGDGSGDGQSGGDGVVAGGDDDTSACNLGAPCNPIPVEHFPFVDSRDTAAAPSDTYDAYACAPGTREWGGEWLYVVDLPTRGVLRAALDDVAGDGVDIDLHLLDDLSSDSCRARHNVRLGELLEAGRYYLSADTWTNSGGTSFAGVYTLNVDFIDLEAGPCALQRRDQKMYWTGCAPGIDCYSAVDANDGLTYQYLRTPAAGPVVLEAHLVTVADDFDGGWPATISEGIAAHYALSQAATGYVMDRDQTWCPQEGGSEFGQGAGGGPVPVLDESWYVNMYWRPRPAKGTRLIAVNPHNGRAVVLSGGYETGPGSNTAIGGISEEAHDHLGTSHRDGLVLGFATDASLALGPIDCD